MNNKSGRFGFLAVQAALCAAVVALVILLRFVGGNVFEELRLLFHTAIQDDSLGVALLEHWQGSVPL